MNKNDIKTISDLFEYVTESERHDVFAYRGEGGVVNVSQARFKADVLHAGAVIASLVQPQGRIAFIGTNSYSYLLLYFGAVVSGRVPVLLDKAINPDAIVQIIRDTESSAVFYSEGYGELAAAAGLQTYCFDAVVSMDADSSLARPADIDCGSVCTVFHTSSSTGAPKLVPLTHRNLAAAVLAMDDVIKVNGPALLCLPLHHVYGLIECVMAVMFKNTTIFINTSIRALLSDIKLFQPTLLALVPSLYSMLLRALKGRCTPEALRALVGPNLNQITFGGAAYSIDPSLMLRAGIVPYVGYGLTETSASITLQAIDPDGNFLDAVGKPMRFADIKIGSQSEILVKGDMVFGGYINNDKANQEAFENGYFKTGDMGYIDGSGCLHVTGRIKNLIILPNGENVPGEKLEACMYSLPYVNECVVKEYEGRITAFIFSEEPEVAGANIASGLFEINARLPLNQHITRYFFRDTPFPKTASQKIIRY